MPVTLTVTLEEVAHALRQSGHSSECVQFVLERLWKQRNPVRNPQHFARKLARLYDKYEPVLVERRWGNLEPISELTTIDAVQGPWVEARQELRRLMRTKSGRARILKAMGFKPGDLFRMRFLGDNDA